MQDTTQSSLPDRTYSTCALAFIIYTVLITLFLYSNYRRLQFTTDAITGTNDRRPPNVSMHVYSLIFFFLKCPLLCFQPPPPPPQFYFQLASIEAIKQVCVCVCMRVFVCVTKIATVKLLPQNDRIKTLRVFFNRFKTRTQIKDGVLFSKTYCSNYTLHSQRRENYFNNLFRRPISYHWHVRLMYLGLGFQALVRTCASHTYFTYCTCDGIASPFCAQQITQKTVHPQCLRCRVWVSDSVNST